MTRRLLAALGAAMVGTMLMPSVPPAHASAVGADLSVTMNDGLNGQPATLYQTITYTILVKNNEPTGGRSAAGVTLNDALADYPWLRAGPLVPVLGSIITGISSTYPGSSCAIQADPPQVSPLVYYRAQKTASCSLGTLPAATTATVSVSVQVDRTNTAGVHHDTPVVNTARVTSSTTDPNPTNNATATVTQVTPFP